MFKLLSRTLTDTAKALRGPNGTLRQVPAAKRLYTSSASLSSRVQKLLQLQQTYKYQQNLLEHISGQRSKIDQEMRTLSQWAISAHQQVSGVLTTSPLLAPDPGQQPGDPGDIYSQSDSLNTVSTARLKEICLALREGYGWASYPSPEAHGHSMNRIAVL